MEIKEEEKNIPKHISKIMPDVLAEIRRNFAKAHRKNREAEKEKK